MNLNQSWSVWLKTANSTHENATVRRFSEKLISTPSTGVLRIATSKQLGYAIAHGALPPRSLFVPFPQYMLTWHKGAGDYQ